MTLGTGISRVTGFARTAVLAAALGSEALANSYNLANSAPNIIYELVLGGVLAGTVLPVFAQYFKTEGESEAWKAVSAVFTFAVVAGLLLAVALFVGAPWVIDAYTAFNDETIDSGRHELATALLRFFSVQVLFYALISVASALLHTRRSFGPPMFAPIFNNLVVIAMLLAVPLVAGDSSLFTTSDLSSSAVSDNSDLVALLGIGTTGGVMAMALFLIPYLRRIANGQLTWNWNLRHPILKRLLVLSGWTIGFVICNQISLFITLALANKGDETDVTAYLYAYIFFILPHGLFAVSVMSALQPSLAEAAAAQAFDQFRASFRQGVRLILLVVVPAAAGYAVLAMAMVSLVLRGQFQPDDAVTTAEVVIMLLVGLPGFSAFIFLTRCFQAMQNARMVFALYLFENAVNVATAFPLYESMGVQGLALSHSIAYTAGAALGFVMLARRIGGIGGALQLGFVLRLLLVTGGMTALVWIVIQATDNAVVDVTTGALVGAVAFIGITKAVGLTELNLLLRRLR